MPCALLTLDAQGGISGGGYNNCIDLMSKMKAAHGGDWLCVAYKCGQQYSWATPVFVFMRAQAYFRDFELMRTTS